MAMIECSKGSSAPRVSVLIPCYNEAKAIARCLESLLAQEEPEGDFEVIIADGMSDDGTREVVREVIARCGGTRTVRIIDNPRRIASSGLNAAIREARGDVLIRFDCHTEYARDYLVQCLRSLEETGADNVGGPARTKARGYIQRAVAAAYHSRFAVGGARFHDINYEGWVDTVTYGCWRREAFRRFGEFDEELVRNQDDEHNLRIVRGGGRIWQSPRIKSWYLPRATLSRLFRQYMQYGYWKVRVIQKHRIPASWRHLVPGVFVASLLVTALMGAILGVASIAVPDPAPGETLRFWANKVLLMGGMGLGAYLGAVAMASVATASRAGWDLLPILPFVFPCYQIGYGWGFLRGILDFVIFRHGPNARLQQLTRA